MGRKGRSAKDATFAAFVIFVRYDFGDDFGMILGMIWGMTRSELMMLLSQMNQKEMMIEMM